MNASDYTIAAIATAAGEGGVSIVRISGPESLKIADTVFACSGDIPSARPSQVIIHGHVTDADGRVIDDVLLLVMRAPRSYTGEDVVEIQGHGGNIVARRILRRVVEAGARLAEPGEFTQRAFLNGRLDLLQAEAVLDLVRAKSDRAAAAALEQLEGSLSARFNKVYDQLLAAAADIEATLDFADDELPQTDVREIVDRLQATRGSMAELISSWDEGHVLRDGAIVVISGRPNVGKSTMMNTLLGRDRSIVSPIPGTTRDTIEEGLILDGFPIRMVDTAGLRETDCVIEKEGVRRTVMQMGKADLHLHVVDASQPLSQEDRVQIERFDPKRCIVILNKIDLGMRVAPAEIVGRLAIPCSLTGGDGVPEVRCAMTRMIEAALHASTMPHAVISERHRILLDGALKETDAALEQLRSEREDQVALAATRLRAALESLGMVTGRVYHTELLNSVFSRFCIGK